MMINISVFVYAFESKVKSVFSIGMSPNTGTVLCSSDLLFCSSPPSTIVCPLKALTVVWASVWSMIGALITTPVALTETGIPVARAPRGAAGIDVHHHQAVRADSRNDLQDQADVSIRDGIRTTASNGGARDGPGDGGHRLAHLDVSRLIVEGGDLRTAEHLQPALGLQGPQQHADVLAGCRKDQSPETQARIAAPRPRPKALACLRARDSY